MITCKEDLINTYVKDTPELREAFLSFAVKFGLIDSKSKFGESSEGAVVAYWHDATGDNPIVGCWFVYADRIKEECRELTLSDLKPTPTKFVKVEEPIFGLKAEFERGELYQKPEFARDYSVASNVKALAAALNGGFCYRQVEIDWRDEVVKFLNDDNIGDSGPIKGHLKGEMSDIDWNYFAESDFIEMCHLVASLTEKPEGV